MTGERPDTTKRAYDIVLFGATGFTGRLTAHYLAQHAPTDCRWALAGRSQSKLAVIKAELVALNPTLTDLPLIMANSTDGFSLTKLAEQARVIVSTVGPYATYGEPLVAACAASGTDYVDLTGEPEFVDEMYLQHHEQARTTGARLVHSCGFDSIPHDLGVFFTVNQLPGDQPLSITGVVRTNARFSAGTLHSAMTGFARGRQTLQAAARRRKAEKREAEKREAEKREAEKREAEKREAEQRDGARSSRRIKVGSGRPHRIHGGWAMPLPTIDPQVVGRSARALERYGPDFSYAHYAAVKHRVTIVGAALGIGTLIGLAQIGPVRRLILRAFPPGDGPSPERRARSSFSVTFTGTAADGVTVQTKVSGGDPGYDETSKMLAESALCLAFDDLPVTSGQVTTAVALGQPLLDRLVQAGLSFEVVRPDR